MQSQVRFNRVPEKVPQKFPGSLGAKSSQVQRVPEKVAEKVPENFLGIFGAGPGQAQQVPQGFQRLASQHASERSVKMKRCGCRGYHRSLFHLYCWVVDATPGIDCRVDRSGYSLCDDETLDMVN